METIKRESTKHSPRPLNNEIISVSEEESDVVIANSNLHDEHLLPSRWLYTQKNIADKYPCSRKVEHQYCSNFIRSSVPCANTSWKDAIFTYLPIVNIVRKYRFRQYFASDLLSGLSVACLHFPQGMAFGISSSLSPAIGLYTSFFPVILYMIFGTLPYTSMGTHAVIALLTAELVESEASKMFPEQNILPSNNASVINATYATTTEQFLLYKISIAAASAFFSGIILFLLGVLRLGIITTYLSTSFIGGVTTGAAFHILINQIQSALGLQIPIVKGIGKNVLTCIAIFENLTSINTASLTTFLICAVILVLVKDVFNEKFKSKLKVPIPIDMIVTILATIISHYGRFHEKFGINVVGNIPTGIPKPSVPELSAFSSIIGKSVEIAALIFLLTISLAKLMAVKHNYVIDDNQELIAYGLSNIFSSFFGCFASCGAPPRDMLLNDLNAQTTLNAVFSTLIMLLILLFVGPFFTSLPVSVLAAMILVAIKRLLAQSFDLPSIWRTNRYDFLTWVVTFSTTILIDLPYGLICGIFCSFFVVVLQSQIAPSYVLLKASEENLFLDPEKHTGLVENSEIKIFRIDYSLFYATSESFQKKLYQTVADPRILNVNVHSPFPKEANICSRQGHEDLKSLNVNADIVSFELNDLSKTKPGIDGGPEKDELKEDLSNTPKLRFIILDCRHVNFMDMKGANTLKYIISEYKKVNVNIFLSGCPSFMIKMIENSECFKVISKDEMFFDLEDSYAAAQMILDKEKEAKEAKDAKEALLLPLKTDV